MNVYEMYKTNQSSVSEGRWFDFGDFQIKLAHSGASNRAHQKAAAKIRERYVRKAGKQELSDEQLNNFITDTLAELTVQDWKNVTDESGKSIAFSPDSCKKLLKELPDFMMEIVELAADFTNYQEEIEKAEKKR